jgi:hypothetical protein
MHDNTMDMPIGPAVAQTEARPFLAELAAPLGRYGDLTLSCRLSGDAFEPMRPFDGTQLKGSEGWRPDHCRLDAQCRLGADFVEKVA